MVGSRTLPGGGLKALGLHAFGKDQHVEDHVEAGFGRLDRIERVVRLAGAGQIEI